MKKEIILLLAVTILFSTLAYTGGQESIVICATTEQYRNDSIQQQLHDRFPEYNIIVMYMPTGKAAAKVFAEGRGTEIGIMLGLETGYLNKSIGIIFPPEGSPYSLTGTAIVDGHKKKQVW